MSNGSGYNNKCTTEPVMAAVPIAAPADIIYELPPQFFLNPVLGL